MLNKHIDTIRNLILNLLLLLLATPKWVSFQKAARNVEITQRKLLFKILRDHSNTSYGRKYGFRMISNLSDFQEKIPLTTYEDYKDYINSISQGRKRALTAKPVELFIPTSGSTTSTKLIPYTKPLKNRFQKALLAWLFNLLSNRKALLFGKTYWQITPAGSREIQKLGEIPIGFDEDSKYFGFFEGLILRSLFAVPTEVSEIEDIDNFRYATLLFLLKEKNLSYISIWNPSFLTLLLKPLSKWAPMLIKDISKGEISFPRQIDPVFKTRITRMFKSDKKRASELQELLDCHSFSFDKIWPHLRLISCWADANSEKYAEELSSLFPGIEIQPKGLISTEAFISFPLVGNKGHVLAVESHFFEFIEMDKETIKFAWQLQKGKKYTVIITNGGGLYRYKMHDLIEVIDFYEQAPILRFIGKEDNISDIMGEKLNEIHVSMALRKVLKEHNLKPTFCLLAPEQDRSKKVHYVLFIELKGIAKWATTLANSLENELRNNFHYDYCRKLGQLGKIKIFSISSNDRSASEIYLSTCKMKGQKLGNIKPMALSSRFGWSKIFEGFYVH